MTSKNTFKIAALVATFLFIASFYGASVAKAECPPGFTQRDVGMTVNGCQYILHICVKCSTGPVPSEIVLMGKEKIDNNLQGWNDQQVQTYIDAQIETYDFIYTNLCGPVYGIPPCPAQSQPMVIHHWMCWEAYVVEYWGALRTVWHPCTSGNADCKITYVWCFDPETGIRYKYQVGPAVKDGTPTCSIPAASITIPVALGDSTGCYQYMTSCP